MKNRLIIIMLALLGITYTSNAQNTFGYRYDSAGNRIKRLVIEMNTSAPETTDTVTNTNYNSNDSGKTQEKNKETTDVFKTGEIKFYPNPTTRILNINFINIDIEQGVLIEVYDINGRLIKTRRSTNPRNQLDFSDNAAGTYILRITASGSKKDYTFIKH